MARDVADTCIIAMFEWNHVWLWANAIAIIEVRHSRRYMGRGGGASNYIQSALNQIVNIILLDATMFGRELSMCECGNRLCQ